MFFFKRFLHDRNGNFGLLTALIAVPLIACAGLAVDLSNAYQIRTELMGAADAAAVGVISASSPALAQAQQMTGDGDIQVATQDGQALFLAQRSSSTAALPSSVSIKVTKTGGAISSAVTFSTQVPTTLLRVLGINSVPVSGSATAAYKTDSYSDFYMLLDNSPSMGIGATTKDITTLKAATVHSPDGAGQSCAFACHMGTIDSKGVLHEDASSNYIIARQNNVTLRIDVVTKAVNTLLSTVTNSESNPGQFRVAEYIFGSTAPASETASGYSIEKVIGLTSDVAAASTAASKIQLMLTPHHSYDDDALTSFNTALTSIGKEMPLNGGTGTSSASRQQVVFFVTDGVSDGRQTSCMKTYVDQDRCIQPIDVSQCTALKNRNIKIAILYTTYVPLTGDHLGYLYRPFCLSDWAAAQTMRL